MPANTSLYNNDSDTQSLSDELSPTDGYFNERPYHPQDILVPNPEQRRSSADKEREAQEELERSCVEGASSSARRESHHSEQTPHQSEYTSHSTPTRRQFDPDFQEEAQTEATPLLPAAPPTYTDATAGRPAPLTLATPSQSRNYNTMGQETVFFGQSQPQNLAEEPLLEGRNKEEGFGQRATRYFSSVPWRSVGRFIFITVALLIGVSFIADVIMNIQDRKKGHPAYSQPNQNMPIAARKMCPQAEKNEVAGADFEFASPDNFMFLQVLDVKDPEGRTHSRVQHSGEVHIRPAVTQLELGVHVQLTMYYSDYSIIATTNWRLTEDSITITVPSHIEGHARQESPCHYMIANIYVVPGQNFENFLIETQTMSVIFHEDVSFSVQNQSLWTTFGHINYNDTAMGVSTRELRITTDTGSVSGVFPLYDLLDISTGTGSIDADINLQQEDKYRPLPAHLSLTSQTGTIHAGTPLLETINSTSKAKIPKRDYITDIAAQTGDVIATLVHGSSTEVKARVGTIEMNLFPYGDLEQRSDLSVFTTSGTIGVIMNSPINQVGKKMRHSFSTFDTQTGSLRLCYPAEWSGKVEGRCLTGSIRARWPGMHWESGSDKWGAVPWQYLKGHKGDGDGRLDFRVVSGSVNINGRGEGGSDEEKEIWTGPRNGPVYDKPMPMPVIPVDDDVGFNDPFGRP